MEEGSVIVEEYLYKIFAFFLCVLLTGTVSLTAHRALCILRTIYVSTNRGSLWHFSIFTTYFLSVYWVREPCSHRGYLHIKLDILKNLDPARPMTPLSLPLVRSSAFAKENNGNNEYRVLWGRYTSTYVVKFQQIALFNLSYASTHRYNEYKNDKRSAAE